MAAAALPARRADAVPRASTTPGRSAAARGRWPRVSCSRSEIDEASASWSRRRWTATQRSATAGGLAQCLEAAAGAGCAAGARRRRPAARRRSERAATARRARCPTDAPPTHHDTVDASRPDRRSARSGADALCGRRRPERCRAPTPVVLARRVARRAGAPPSRRRPRPAGQPADRTRASGRRPHRGRAHEPADRAGTGDRREDRRGTRPPRDHQARRAEPHGGRGLGGRRQRAPTWFSRYPAVTHGRTLDDAAPERREDDEEARHDRHADPTAAGVRSEQAVVTAEHPADRVAARRRPARPAARGPDDRRLPGPSGALCRCRRPRRAVGGGRGRPPRSGCASTCRPGPGQPSPRPGSSRRSPSGSGYRPHRAHVLLAARKPPQAGPRAALRPERSGPSPSGPPAAPTSSATPTPTAAASSRSGGDPAAGWTCRSSSPAPTGRGCAPHRGAGPRAARGSPDRRAAATCSPRSLPTTRRALRTYLCGGFRVIGAEALFLTRPAPLHGSPDTSPPGPSPR